jgi:hypothetical protein
MATDVTNAPAGRETYPARGPNDPSLGTLVSGIIDDAKKLIEQEATLLKQEIRKEFQDAKDTGKLLGAGIGLLAAAGVLLLFMLVYLLYWLAEPHLPLWSCYAIVGGVLALIGGVVEYRGQQKLEQLKVVPEQTTQALKESLQWKTNPN